MTEVQKLENELSILKELLKKETNLLKQGELTAKIKKLSETISKIRPAMKSTIKTSGNSADLRSSDIGENESQKINRDWSEKTGGKKK